MAARDDEDIPDAPWAADSPGSAAEVLRCYKAGERRFERSDLCDQQFDGAILAGAAILAWDRHAVFGWSGVRELI